MELITITLLYYLGFISISTITIIYFSYKTSIIIYNKLESFFQLFNFL
jgi:hypothetical protein